MDNSVIKQKEIKGILLSILLIGLAIFLMLKPMEIISTLIKIIGIFILICGVFDFANYLIKKENKLVDYGLIKGVMELTIGIMFIFKHELLIDLFPSLLGIIIVFINIFKLQMSLNLKDLNDKNYLTGIIISSLSIILGIIILINPFETVEIVVIVSGAVLLLSELSNIIYSIMVLRNIKRNNINVIKVIE